MKNILRLGGLAIFAVAPPNFRIVGSAHERGSYAREKGAFMIAFGGIASQRNGPEKGGLSFVGAFMIDASPQCSYNVGMNKLEFGWDPAKARSNLRKHGVSFEEAQTIFFDEYALEFYDDVHADWEDRFLLLDMSSQLKLLLVSHCYREADGVIRIISARKATATESRHYRRP